MSNVWDRGEKTDELLRGKKSGLRRMPTKVRDGRRLAGGKRQLEFRGALCARADGGARGMHAVGRLRRERRRKYTTASEERAKLY